jgi:hypothetical protein
MMKKNTKYIIYSLLAILSGFAVYWFFIRKTPSGNGKSKTSMKDIFDKIKKAYGHDTAKLTEQVARFESNHFRSSLSKETKNYGNITAASYNFPFGWESLSQWWIDNKYSPVGVTNKYVSGENWQYLKFSSTEAGLSSVAKILSMRNNDAGAYYGLEQPGPLNAQWYREEVSKMKTEFV